MIVFTNYWGGSSPPSPPASDDPAPNDFGFPILFQSETFIQALGKPSLLRLPNFEPRFVFLAIALDLMSKSTP